MKIKLLAILVAAFVVLGLPLFARGAKQEGEGEAAAQRGVPQYGGTLTAIHRSEPSLGDPDPHDHGYPSWYWMINVLERTIGGDYARYGSFRDGEGGWDNSYWSWPDLKYMRGYLAESWEVTADKIVFKIRPGVYFTGKSPKLNFEPREYTAHDYVWNRHRELDTPTNFSARRMEKIDFIKTPIKDHIYAEDDYTVVYETKRFNFEWYMDLYHCHGMQIARESIEAGEGDWDYMVGTGPFIVKKHVPNAYVEFERNPNYWRKTTVPYGGKEYQLPFVDTLKMPVIKDVTTSVAALRTGKLDIFMYSDWQHHETLMKTNPEMEYLSFLEHNTYNFHFVTDKPPFDNRDVRRALMFGTDTKAICKAIYGYTPTTLHWPLGGGIEGNVGFDELPPATAKLFEYNPDLARQMLADAGYPDGFKINVTIGFRPMLAEMAEAAASMWKKDFGIDMNIKVVPLETALTEHAKDLHHMTVGRAGNRKIADLMGYFHSSFKGPSYSRYSNPHVDEQLDLAARTFDPAERTAVLEDLSVYLIDEATQMLIGGGNKFSYWWPWVENYYGESIRYMSDPPFELIWLDQDQKKSMGH